MYPPEVDPARPGSPPPLRGQAVRQQVPEVMAASHFAQRSAAEENAWIWKPKFWRWAAAKGWMQNDKLKISPQASGRSQVYLQEQVTAPRMFNVTGFSGTQWFQEVQGQHGEWTAITC